MMTKRRGRGEGSVFRRKSDGRWIGRLDLGYKDGRRHRKEFTGRTRQEVQQKLAAARRAHDDGLPIPSDRLRLGAFLESWLVSVQPNLRQSTHTRYQQLLRRHVIPALGGRPLTRLEPDEVQELYAQKQTEGLSPRTILHVHRVLRRSLSDAVKFGRVARNVCDIARPPKVPKQEMEVLSPAQVRQLLAASAEDPQESALVTLAVTSGMRQGEILAALWEDCDLDRGVIQVRRSVRWMTGQGSVVTEPKSDASRRNVTLTPTAVSALRRHRIQQAENRLRAVAWEDNGLVFANAVGRHIEATNFMRRVWRPLLERAGLPPRLKFHSLRHTAASLLLSQNTHIRVVADLLGHADPGLTLRVYSHAAANLHAEAAEKMEKLLAAPGG